MNRKDAFKYLVRKGKITEDESMSKKAKEEINKVMKEGKIYGDPIVNLKY